MTEPMSDESRPGGCRSERVFYRCLIAALAVCFVGMGWEVYSDGVMMGWW